MTRKKTEPYPVLQSIAYGVWLAHRLALVHPEQERLAIADLHFGYAERRRQRACLIPVRGCGELEDRLQALLADHQPQRLILAGDVMDSLSNVNAALDFLDLLRASVPQLVVLTGNHDRSTLRRAASCRDTHEEPGFFFHHGHQNHDCPPGSVEIIGHHHPSVRISDSAGLPLTLPALIRERDPRLSPGERWILPAFSPWCAGGKDHSGCERLATWACAPYQIINCIRSL